MGKCPSSSSTISNLFVIIMFRHLFQTHIIIVDLLNWEEKTNKCRLVPIKQNTGEMVSDKMW